MKYRPFVCLKDSKVCPKHINTKKKGTTDLLNPVYPYARNQTTVTFEGEEVKV